MKTNLLLATLLVLSQTGVAHASAKAAPVLEVKQMVGFAPPEMQGTFRTDVLSDGTVEYIDNKGKVTVIAKLAPGATSSLLAKIAAVVPGTVSHPDQVMCEDAPSSEVNVYKADGKAILISQTMGCITSDLEGADQVKALAEQFNSLAQSLK